MKCTTKISNSSWILTLNAQFILSRHLLILTPAKLSITISVLLKSLILNLRLHFESKTIISKKIFRKNLNLYLHSSLSLAVTVRTVCWMSSFSSTSASYRLLSKYGGLSFLSAIPIRMNLETRKKFGFRIYICS